MGTDCHMYLEKKTRKGWKMLKEIDIGRNYTLFGLLAGVRDGSIKPIAHPKGLPKDLSKTLYDAKKAFDQSKPGWDELPWLGEHSFSYLYLHEIANYKKYRPYHKDICSCYGYNKKDNLVYIHRDLAEIVMELMMCNKSRIVFGFDS